MSPAVSIIMAVYNAEEFLSVIKRMATYSNNSLSRKPQVRAEAREAGATRFLGKPCLPEELDAAIRQVLRS